MIPPIIGAAAKSGQSDVGPNSPASPGSPGPGRVYSPAMIPVGDVIPSRRTPVVTLGLIVVFAGIHVVGVLGAPVFDAWVGQPTPSGFSPARALLSLAHHESWPSLIASLLFLWLFGGSVEDRLGGPRFALLFAASGLAAAAATEALPRAWAVGSGPAGAIAGVIGAYAVLFPKSRMLLLVPLPFFFDLIETPAVHLMLAWLIVQLALSFGAPERVVLVNLAGFACGAALVVLLGGPRLRDRYWAEKA